MGCNNGHIGGGGKGARTRGKSGRDTRKRQGTRKPRRKRR